MTRLQKLRQLGLSFDQPGAKCETLGLREQCKFIYQEAFDRVSARADLVDSRRAVSVNQDQDLTLSDFFRAKDQELSTAIETEWLSDHPDLQKFKDLVSQWERLCMQELKANERKT